MSVTAGRDVITLETTQYPGWTELRGELMEVVRALQETSAPDGITRVGLRYIDEIRLPNEPDTLAGWSGWVDERLVAPFTLEHEPGLSSGTIVLQYGEVPGYVTLFRAGPLQSGRAVQQQGGPLRTPYETPAGAFFLLDTDASWADPTGQIPEFEPASIEEVVNQLHESCHTLFEASITDRLRQEVLRRTREEVWGA